MKSVKTKFEKLITQLNYSNIRLIKIRVPSIRKWCYRNMPGVVKELHQLGWELEEKNTWLESMFITYPMLWYGKKVAVYVTSSYTAYIKASQLLKTKVFKQFREDFSIDCHAVILLHPIIFIKEENLDDIYLSFDFEKGYSAIDFSYCDEYGNFTEEVKQEWSWLAAEAGDVEMEEEGSEVFSVGLWSDDQNELIFNERSYYE